MRKTLDSGADSYRFQNKTRNLVDPIGIRQSRFIIFLFLLIGVKKCSLSYALSNPVLSYSEAEEVRILKGHAAAMPLYQSLLATEGNSDVTAASLIAASDQTLDRQDMACNIYVTDQSEHAISLLREVLLDSNFTRNGVADFFGIDRSSLYASSFGPIFAKSAKGFAVPKADLETGLIGGSKTVHLLETFGLLFPSEYHPNINLMIPYVHLFPMEVGGNHLIFATDWHPSTLATTSVGKQNDGAVMYIGPDSLALQQHMPIWYRAESDHQLSILDLCCGSGVQGISSLIRLGSTVTVVGVDVNNRALRFTKFNALLNGVSDKVYTVWGDLSNFSPSNPLSRYLLQKEPSGFDLILANPPFLPVPKQKDGKSNVSIVLRHGDFSDGGATGEILLESILRLSSVLLRKSGFVGVVSEFMNPGLNLGEKLEKWWNQQSEIKAEGVLFTNEYPVMETVYAQRRAANEAEEIIWLRHLQKYQIRSVSPGLLFIKASTDVPIERTLHLSNILVPKSDLGSIWTPHNEDAISFTKAIWEEKEASHSEVKTNKDYKEQYD